jgi:Ran GTPase-activating protein (RanGAP) involved in mRNA processing and transport
MSPFDDLSDVLSDCADTLTFRALQSVIDTWPADGSLPAAIRQAEDVLAQWPDDARAVDCFEEYEGFIGARIDAPSWTLVRQVTGDAALQEICSRRSRFSEAPLFRLEACGTAQELDDADFQTLSPAARVLAIMLLKTEETSLLSPVRMKTMLSRLPQHLSSLELRMKLGKDAWEEVWKFLCSTNAADLEALYLVLGRVEIESLEHLFGHPPAKLCEVMFPMSVYPPYEPHEFSALERANVLARRLRKVRFLGPIYDPGAKNFAHVCASSPLAELSIHGGCVRADGVQALATAPFMSTLRRLDLSCTYPEEQGCAALAHAPVTNLEQLEMHHAEINDAGVEALAKSSMLSALTHLNLASNDITDRGLMALSNSPAWTGARKLAALQLHHNKIGDEGVIALASSPMVYGLRTLSLSANRVGDAGMRAIAESPLLTNLEELRIAGNPISAVGLLALARSRTLGALRELAIDFGAVHPIAMEEVYGALAQSPALRRIRKLTIVSATFEDAAARALVSVPDSWPHLRELVFDEACIGDEGLRALANAPCLRKLWVFQLTDWNSDITEAGINALAESTTLTQLIDLAVPVSDASEKAVFSLADSLVARRLEDVDLGGLEEPWLQSTNIRPVLRSRIEGRRAIRRVNEGKPDPKNVE